MTHGAPVAFYSDKHTVIRVNREAKGGLGMTQFGRALAELNIEILCADSSQAKDQASDCTSFVFSIQARDSGGDPGIAYRLGP